MYTFKRSHLKHRPVGYPLCYKIPLKKSFSKIFLLYMLFSFYLSINKMLKYHFQYVIKPLLLYKPIFKFLASSFHTVHKTFSAPSVKHVLTSLQLRLFPAFIPPKKFDLSPLCQSTCSPRGVFGYFRHVPPPKTSTVFVCYLFHLYIFILFKIFLNFNNLPKMSKPNSLMSIIVLIKKSLPYFIRMAVSSALSPNALATRSKHIPFPKSQLCHVAPPPHVRPSKTLRLLSVFLTSLCLHPLFFHNICNLISQFLKFIN